MKIYDSFGTFDDNKKEFNLAGQATNIGTDVYEITAYYDICNKSRYAILVILQTKDGNDKDLSTSPADCAFMVSEIKFSDLNKNYVSAGDLDINNAKKGEVIDVIVHHAIGFNPETNTYDDDYIKNYKAEEYTYYSKGSPPGVGGKGILI